MSNDHHHHAHFGRPDAGRLAVARCGPIAKEVLAEDGELYVLAMAADTFHLASPRGVVSIGTHVEAGPINVELAEPVAGGWLSLGITPALEGRIEHGVPFITEHLALDLSHAVIWMPPEPPPFESSRAARGVQRVLEASRGRLPRGGLAALVITGKASPRNVDAQMAEASVAELRSALGRAISDLAVDEGLARSATLLVGLGAGQIPAGDDLLRGVMLVLSASGQTALRDALWDAIAPELNDLTVPLSAMLLSAAADGLANAAMHDLLNVVLAGKDDLDGELTRAVAGHQPSGTGSSWDTVAGLVIGLQAVLDMAQA